MAGAAPGRTQQLLDRSLRQRSFKTSVICGKGIIFNRIYLSLRGISLLSC